MQNALLGDVPGAQRERLAELEAVVEAGLEEFMRVGEALDAIRREQLFKATHDSWSQYLADRWELAQATAYSLIYSSRVAAVIRDGGGELPAGVSANSMRELTPLLNAEGPDAVVEVWDRVMESHDGGRRPPSSGDVREALRSSGGRMAAGRRRRATPLWTIGAGVDGVRDRLAQVRAGLEGKSLGPTDRERVRAWAVALRAVADELDALGGERVEPATLETAEAAAPAQRRPRRAKAEPGTVWCDRHSFAPRDENGVCTVCGVPDMNPKYRRAGGST